MTDLRWLRGQIEGHAAFLRLVGDPLGSMEDVRAQLAVLDMFAAADGEVRDALAEVVSDIAAQYWRPGC
ncbi:hypothetical protein ABZ249_29870 [Nocardiopsis sp. NPDC006139]|uniref:hypothetical protein n=1 Tax=Nocardiopsis sp. NPDC006139 TaxID=3154578 RepID=UPI0033B29B82